MTPPKYIGLLSESPIRLAGLVSFSEETILDGRVPLIPIACNKLEFLSGPKLDYLILDLHESVIGSYSLHTILRAAVLNGPRPGRWRAAVLDLAHEFWGRPHRGIRVSLNNSRIRRSLWAIKPDSNGRTDPVSGL
jgi:hypothetical protein